LRKLEFRPFNLARRQFVAFADHRACFSVKFVAMNMKRVKGSWHVRLEGGGSVRPPADESMAYFVRLLAPDHQKGYGFTEKLAGIRGFVRF
jgi:hypothetical protein